MSRRNMRESAPPHVRVYWYELESEAYRSLSTDARALLVELRSLYGGPTKPNRVFMSVREIMRRLNVSQRPAERARDQLIDRGFVRVLNPGSFNQKRRQATEYALTNEQLDSAPNAPAPKDYMSWRQKNTVADSTTYSSGRRYRQTPREATKEPHGSGIDYQNTPKPDSHGSASRYTDRLPGLGPEKATGHKCRNGLLLNTCCLVCGVWITEDGQEFDGGRHTCDRVSKAAYQKRCGESAESTREVAA